MMRRVTEHESLRRGIDRDEDLRLKPEIAEVLSRVGIDLDQNRNRRSDIVISSDRSRCRVFVIKTNEERMLAEHTLGLLRAQGQTNSLAESAA